MRASNPAIIWELLLPRLPHQAIFLCGGWEGSLHDPSIAPSTSVQVFDPNGCGWVRHDTYLPAMDTRHAYSACIELDNTVYLIGGFVQPKSDDEAQTEAQGPTARVSAYSLRQRVWRERAAMHEQRNFVSACRCRGRLYAMGGHNGQQRLASAESYDPVANRWHRLAPMHNVRSDAGATSLNG
uniref:Kelch-like protein 17 n=1 Tax=Macrostomum lignano TaxID=282301 RepID=A0A1I8JK12_9PLAT